MYILCAYKTRAEAPENAGGSARKRGKTPRRTRAPGKSRTHKFKVTVGAKLSR